MKLLLTDCATLSHNNDIPLDTFERFGEVVCFDNLLGDELLEQVKDADIILCNKTVIDRQVMEHAKKLKYIGLFATGFNNIDIEYAKQKGITVCNAGSYSTAAVAQQTFAYILAHFSAVERYSALVRQGGWIASPTFSMLCCPTDELYGKTIGLIGYGSIGQKVAQIALAFDMRVLVFTRTPKQAENIEFVSLDTLLEQSDIVSVHCPLNEQSARMFNSEAFSKMKNGAFFVNTARGGVVDEPALLEALKSGKLAGAAVDVLTHEPMREDCVLRDAPNLIITPHTSWAPVTTRLRLLSIVTDNISAFLNGTPKNVVNK